MKTLEELLTEAGWTRTGFCKKNLHDMRVERGKTKDGKCRLCRLEYVREYRKNQHPSRLGK